MRIGGTIYGTNEPDTALRNSAAYQGAAFYKGGTGTAQYGTFNGTTWNRNGTLSDTNDTIRVVNGVLQ